MVYRSSKKDLARAELIISEKPQPADRIEVRPTPAVKAVSSFKRAADFERDYPTFLLSLASSLRTGLDPLTAMIEVRKLFDARSILRQELESFKIAIESGANETEALAGFAVSIKHPDIALFRTAYLISRKEGSSLAETLHRLAKVTRHRQSFRRKIRSAVAMQKLSAFGIGGCAVLICLIQAIGNPRILSDAFHNSVGIRLMAFGSILIVTGLFWMLRITRARI